ncbi:MAG: urease accessory protein UreH domain-containing protein [Eubacteriales bacterium]
MSTNIITSTIKIVGMTCISCENKIERKLQGTKGITSAKVSYSAGTAFVSYDMNMIKLENIIGVIEQLDYKVEKEIKKTAEKTNLAKIFGAGIIIFALYMIISRLSLLNVFNAFPLAEEGVGYGMLFVIGLLTSIHCVAMCGGINISQCVPRNTESTDNSKSANLRSSILYNSGRIISYTIIGGIVGAIGSAVSFSGTSKGVVQLAAGVFMIIMGLNMLNIFPWLRRLNLRMPKFFAKKIYQQKKSKSPFYVGLLNGLMPCGPLQAMQLYALSTGSPVKGALSMLLFSLGTVPLMFGLGALSSFLSKKFTGRMITASAVLVVVLGMFMFSSGFSLSGFALPAFITDISGSVQNNDVNDTVITDGIQTITTGLPSGRYEPIIVQKGIPVKWIIQAKDRDINGCNNEIIIPEYKIEKKLATGDNIIEFNPTETGTFAYSCWMGMIKSTITVVDDINTNTGSSETVNQSDYKIPTDKIAVAEIKDGKQVVKIDVEENKFSPSVIVMQSDIETTWIINYTKANTDINTLIFPLYNAQLSLIEGENTITLIPETDFDFSASDNSFYGYVKVVDDINKIDIAAIKEEVGKYVPAIQEVINESALPSCH